MNEEFVPGVLVRHPQHEDWGVGQVQSAIDNRITVNFENRGKELINGDVISLILLEENQ
jgi:transcription elongation factor GreA-like protein